MGLWKKIKGSRTGKRIEKILRRRQPKEITWDEIETKLKDSGKSKIIPRARELTDNGAIDPFTSAERIFAELEKFRDSLILKTKGDLTPKTRIRTAAQAMNPQTTVSLPQIAQAIKRAPRRAKKARKKIDDLNILTYVLFEARRGRTAGLVHKKMIEINRELTFMPLESVISELKKQARLKEFKERVRNN